MKSKIYINLDKNGIKISKPPSPQGSYVPWIISGNYIYLSGQIPLVDGKLQYKGTVPNEVSIDKAVDAARICAINLINQLNEACDGDLDKIKKIVKVTGYVACSESFIHQPTIINGASDLFKTIFGENGIHVRAAIGCSSLPLGSPVEVEAIFEKK
ncbi:MAG: hypothetical protein CFH01_01920 [Alphaproteobacteria bacterium MarineAlpha2_Bin1]|nr:MAG: hypothetical protein CFH01_01920 [Alphaproteobacteria bacterium MarineAlpha2_Bin1]